MEPTDTTPHAIILSEGKTKSILQGPEPSSVLLMTKDDLTGGDAAIRATIPGIAAHKTAQAAAVFECLKANGLPVAFRKQIDAVTLLCDSCVMLPLECVIRRYAWGSVLLREPELKGRGGEGHAPEAPHRFEPLRTELFHKFAVCTPPLVEHPTLMPEGEARDRYLKDGTWEKGVFTDPFIDITSESWVLYPAKLPLHTATPLLAIPPELSLAEVETLKEEIMKPAFLALERAWASVITNDGPVALADIKLEVGRRQSDGALVIADVIDNDSWRIWPGGDPKNQLDKQSFRDGSSLEKVADNYALVTELVKRFPSASINPQGS